MCPKKKYTDELENNISRCVYIRDKEGSKTIAIIQAVRVIQKLISNNPEHPEFDRDLDALIQIRDNETIEDTLRVMAMNTINTMLDSVGGDKTENPTAEDIMKKIRGEKK